MIHSSSNISKNAKIGKNVKIGPFCYIGEHVEIDDDVELISNVHIEGKTKIGKIFKYCLCSLRYFRMYTSIKSVR